jgi:chromosome transmission fidelity protein 18
VNQQIIRPAEKAVLTRLVSIMTALEIHFVQERGEDGQLTYRLDPYVSTSPLNMGVYVLTII